MAGVWVARGCWLARWKLKVKFGPGRGWDGIVCWVVRRIKRVGVGCRCGLWSCRVLHFLGVPSAKAKITLNRTLKSEI